MNPLLNSALAALSARRIEAHLRFLSHPLLEGRAAGSRGGRLAEEYIRAALAGAGIGPAPGTDYRQEVPMIGMDPTPELSFFAGDAERLKPRYRDDFVLKSGLPQELVRVDAELVFVGYGIQAPEYDWDDFGDADLSGKVLLVRVNDPGSEDRPDFFGGRALTYHGRWTYKLEEAARRGAAGALLIHTDESAGYGWNVVRSSNTGEQYQLAELDEPQLQVRGWVTELLARSLLAAGGNDSDTLLAASGRPDFSPVTLGVNVRATVKSTLNPVRAANVIGVLPGSAGAHAQEPVVLMSHHDHLGVKVADDGSRLVYAGAHDNASGVALLLAIAEAVAHTTAANGTPLTRPLLFLASTAEESGLLGSEWYVRHPVYPLGSTRAVLNVDGANLHGPTRDIAPLGVDRSYLGEYVRRAAEEEGLTVAPEQHPEQGMFFRQDHFPFVRAGVSGIAFDHGLDYEGRPEGWGEAWYQEFNTQHYHQPSDAFSEDFDYRGALQQGRVMIRVALALAE